MIFINLRYVYDKVKSSKFELLKEHPNCDIISDNMDNIKSHMIINNFVDINTSYIYNTAVKIQLEKSFYKMLKYLNDIKYHIGYGREF